MNGQTNKIHKNKSTQTKFSKNYQSTPKQFLLPETRKRNHTQ